MPEKKQKDLLHDLLGVRRGDAEGKQVAENGDAQLIEEGNDVFFQTGRPRRSRSGQDRKTGDLIPKSSTPSVLNIPC